MSASPGPFHDGELEVQRRAGLSDEAQAVGRIVSPFLVPAAARFLATQRLAVVASLDASGQPWASILSGPAGFLRAVDERLLRAEAVPADDDPLASNLRARPELALLVLDPETRRRMRLSGRGMQAEDAVFLLTDQVYGNCPKYIHRRRPSGDTVAARGPAVRSTRLGERQGAWIAGADTLFVASFHPEGGADASHRGGDAGFVRVLDDRRLAIPDYTGNAMFNTLGNLLEYPRAGLLFVDFASGDTLQIAGRAEIAFEPQREIAFEVQEVRETPGGHRLAWDSLDRSSVNPGA